jgi:hypothetical protein
MLQELWQYFTTSSPWHIRRMGYVSELIAIAARHQRCKTYWTPHLELCKEQIRKAVYACPTHQQVVVLGGGLAFDLPLSFLARSFKNVILVDLVFSSHVRTEASRLGIELLQTDITGIVKSTFTHSKTLPQPHTPLHLEQLLEQTSLTISANILSQLPLTPLYQLARHHDDNTLSQWATDVLQHHCRMLKQSAGKICLISDMYSTTYSADDNTSDSHSLLWHLPRPVWEMEWEWHLAPIPEIDRTHHIVHTVGVITKKEGLYGNHHLRDKKLRYDEKSLEMAK